MDEQEFLRLLDRKRDAFIAEKVFGWKWVKSAVCLFLVPPDLYKDEDYRNRLLNPVYFEDMKLVWSFNDEMWKYLSRDFTRFELLSRYSQSWGDMGVGVEHANENGFFVAITSGETGNGQARVGNKTRLGYPRETVDSAILAFWVAYLNALGVLD